MESNLFLKFKKEKEEIAEILPETVKKLNVQFHLTKEMRNHRPQNHPPFLNSIKEIYISQTILAFSIELDRLIDIEGLKIKVMNITLFLFSGQKKRISINREYLLSDIEYEDGFYLEYLEGEDEGIIDAEYEEQNTFDERFEPVSKVALIKESKEEKVKEENFEKIPLLKEEYEEWRKLKGDKSWTATMFSAREELNEIRELKEELKETNSLIRQIALKNADSLNNLTKGGISLNYNPSNTLNPPPEALGLPQSPPSNNRGPPQRAKPPSINRKYDLNEANARLKLKEQQISKDKVALIREMKEKIQKHGDIRKVLKKVPEDELNREIPKTDHLSFVLFKQGKIEDKRDKNKEEES
ncbi:MAG: hypothetical protein GF353_26955 [Candidatus Lokiarchaeota archaeon]|nr:hypothetical protein [Candidatus Lokiarchaeota archaeon]